MIGNQDELFDKKIKFNLLLLLTLLILLVIVVVFTIMSGMGVKFGENSKIVTDSTKTKVDTNFVDLWTAPSDWRLDKKENREQILYGKELVVHTSKYLGPKGSVRAISNGMNCQNCHLKAGTQPWGNNYFAVSSTYPKFRARSGSKESMVKRVNDCFERSLNGKGLDSTSKEMQAILAYINWLGEDVPKKYVPKGSGIFKMKSLKRACDLENGKLVYEQKCQSCHQANGEGVLTADKKEYTYPPVWGNHSFNNGAGLYRISNLAGYVRYNMPFGVTYENTQLTDEEAWDVAGYINSMPRPAKDLSKDWPDISKKPFDHPFGPYKDPFSEQQHKFGPYKPIKEWYKK